MPRARKAAATSSQAVHDSGCNARRLRIIRSRPVLVVIPTWPTRRPSTRSARITPRVRTSAPRRQPTKPLWAAAEGRDSEEVTMKRPVAPQGRASYRRCHKSTPERLARDLILGNGADRRIARPPVSKCSIGGNFRAHAMEGVWWLKSCTGR
jgi:hypothetical protein